jgi:RNA polymerase sigma-70 factor (ECF subfamily)
MTNVNILIERWRAGDERAVEALYNYHRERVFRLAYGILDNRIDAEEVTQESLIYALTNIKRYDPRRARFSTWLHTITVSRCRNVLRSRRGLRLSLASWLKKGGDVPDPTPDQERQAVRAEIRSQVWQAVQQLSPPLREAILLLKPSFSVIGRGIPTKKLLRLWTAPYLRPNRECVWPISNCGLRLVQVAQSAWVI